MVVVYNILKTFTEGRGFIVLSNGSSYYGISRGSNFTVNYGKKNFSGSVGPRMGTIKHLSSPFALCEKFTEMTNKKGYWVAQMRVYNEDGTLKTTYKPIEGAAYLGRIENDKWGFFDYSEKLITLVPSEDVQMLYEGGVLLMPNKWENEV